jgi:hypothetical protein
MPRLRSTLAFVAILVFLAFYVWLAATLGDWLPAHWAVDLVFYLVAGLAWVPVAGSLLKWGAEVQK